MTLEINYKNKAEKQTKLLEAPNHPETRTKQRLVSLMNIDTKILNIRKSISTAH